MMGAAPPCPRCPVRIAIGNIGAKDGADVAGSSQAAGLSGAAAWACGPPGPPSAKRTCTLGGAVPPWSAGGAPRNGSGAHGPGGLQWLKPGFGARLRESPGGPGPPFICPDERRHACARIRAHPAKRDRSAP